MRLTVRLCVFAMASGWALQTFAASDESIFIDSFEDEPAFTDQADQRFAVAWISGGVLQNAAIRGDASLRSTSDPGLIVFHTRPGHYCLKATSPNEGAVGVLQNQGGTHGIIDVTMGIGNPCPNVRQANISVRTMQLP